MTLNEQIRDSLIKQSVRTHRFEQSLLEKVDVIIDRLHEQLAKLVIDRSPTTIKQADAMEAGSRFLIRRAYKEINELMEDELDDYSDAEVLQIQRILTKHIRNAMNG